MISLRMKNLHPYVPGEQPKDRVYIKLNANENPYEPAPEVIEAVCDFIKKNPMKLALYPDPDSYRLRAAIAGLLNKTGGVLCRTSVSGRECAPDSSDTIPFEVTPDMIFVGNGSDEVLSFVFYAFFDSADTLVLPEFTYSFYPVYAGFYNIPTEIVPLKTDWSIDTEKLLERAKANRSGIIFANPNAPTGLSLSRAEVRRMLRAAEPEKVFVVDEAYCDFGGESCIPLLAEFKNLVIVRTFSKSLCAAGMRLGYIVANPELISAVTTAKNSFNHFPVDAVAQTAGKAACENPWYYAQCAKKIAAERDRFIQFLLEKGWDVIPSRTNFVFARNREMSGEAVYQRIKQNGILVRHFDTRGIEEHVRISIGTQAQMDELKGIISGL